LSSCAGHSRLENNFSWAPKLKPHDTNRYYVYLEKGGFLDAIVMQKATDVAIDIYNPGGKKVFSFDTPNEKTGPENISFTAPRAGDYTIKVYRKNPGDYEYTEGKKTKGKAKGDYQIRVNNILTEEGYKAFVAETNRWFVENARELKSVEPGTGNADLEWLKDILANVQVVGLGQATMGTKEFFQLNNRMLQFLVKNLDFKVFAINAPFAACDEINEYVLHGEEYPEEVVRNLGSWTWNNEEMIQLVEWVRDYNRWRSPGKQVRFFGLDIKMNAQAGGLEKLRKYLERVDADFAWVNIKVFRRFSAAEKDHASANGETLKNDFAAVITHMDTSKADFLKKSSEREYADALTLARVMAQYIDAYIINGEAETNTESDLRSAYSVQNFVNYLRQEPEGMKALVFGPNMNIMKDGRTEITQGPKTLGSYLKETFKQRYYAFAQLFNQGSFQAIYMDEEDRLKGLQQFTVPPAIKGSLEWQLSQTRKDKFIINFRQPLPSGVRQIVEKQFTMRNYGATASAFQYAGEGNYYMPVILKYDFDGIIYINNSSSPTPPKPRPRRIRDLTKN
jgi:erythromycin esterase